MGLGLIHKIPFLNGTKTSKVDKNIIKIQRRKNAKELINVILKYSYITYIIAIVWIFLLPSKLVHSTSKTQENALLAGQVNTYYGNSDTLIEMEYAVKLKNMKNYQDFIKGEMEQLGLLTEKQDFSYTSIMDNININGTNVYGIFKAPRSDGTESIVISAPWTCSESSLNTHGVAFLLSLMKYIKKQAYWSKDLIFIVYDHNTIGASAWLQSYHYIKANDIKYSPLSYKSGIIQEALNIELCSPSGVFSSLGLYYEGVNGQLSNLDIVNTVFKLANSMKIPLSIFDSTVKKFQKIDDKEYYKESAINLLRTVKHQIHGIPLKAHGVFTKYKIDSITIHGNNNPNEKSSFGIKSVGTYIEALLRSFNNLLEKLHHSNYIYMLPYASYILDVGYFFPPVVLLAFYLAAKSYLLWLESGDNDPKQPLPKNVTSIKIFDASETKGTLIDCFPAFSRRERPVIQSIAIVVLCYICGFVTLVSPFVAHSIINNLGLNSQYIFMLSVVISVAFSIIVLSTVVPYIRKMLISDSSENETNPEIAQQPIPKEPVADWHLVKCISCSLLCCTLSTFGLINYGLSLFFGIISTPIYTLIRPTNNRLFRLIQYLLLLLVSPVGLFFIISSLSKVAPEKLFIMLLNEYELFNTWLLPFICLFYLPVNLCSLVILSSPIKPLSIKKSKKKN